MTQPLRIGVSGAPGVGKTTLARALGETLAIPVLPEEMRAHLERTGQPLAGLTPGDAAAVLHALWRERAALEQATPSFVADNCSLDFASYGVFYDCLAEASPDEPDEPVLLREPRAHLAAYDAIIVLPCGVLPYERDGVRPASRSAQLRHHLIIDGMLRRWADPRKLHHLPASCVALADRVAWVRARLESRRAVAAPARRGRVYLVGAGPGDPGLLTVRARELLAVADVVAYDALVPPSLLSVVAPGAERLAVGRRHGGGPTSYRLHPDVISRALAGKTVVRLKAGDPLIFGRGGEEAEELREAGIPFEIVPGVSAALGAAAYAGIPLTHRALASDVTFASGHDVEGGHASQTAWAHLGGATGTLVLFMASRTLVTNFARLVAAGRSPATPAAYISAATTPQQQVITGTLETLPGLVAGIDHGAPALIIVGEVVRLRERVNWCAATNRGSSEARAGAGSAASGLPGGSTESRAGHGSAESRGAGSAESWQSVTSQEAGTTQGQRPLSGRRLLVGRARPGASAIAEGLRARGAEVVETPEISVAPIEDSTALDAALARLSESGRIVLACAAGVDATVVAAARLGVALARPILAVGAEAAHALARHGLVPAATANGACGEALATYAAELRGRPLLLITAEGGRDSLRTELLALGGVVESVVAYRYVAQRTLPLPTVDGVVLPSSSAARHVLASAHGAALRGLPTIVMGPRTEAAARAAGAQHIVRAARDEVAALVDTVVEVMRGATTTQPVVATTQPVATVQSVATTAQPAAVATAQPGATAPAKPPHGLVVVYTGKGKGKTTAALGIVFRALGRGMRVGVVQFIKGKWKTGERMFAEALPGLTFLVMGKGFTWNSDDLSRDAAAAQAAWQTAKAMIASGENAIVVVDEITFAINYGFIEIDDVLEALRTRPPHVHVIATGRNAPEPLCALADLVTDMTAIKHPFERGISAQLGVDY